MSGGLIFLGGFIIGAMTVFIVMHAFVWYPRYMELKDRWAQERQRRIEAEDTEAFAYGSSAVAPKRNDWPDIIDLTGLDDVPEAP